MVSWAVPIYVMLGGTGLAILFAWWKYLTVKACPACHYPIHRCECNHCPHDLQTPQRWTQDGWVSTCLVCKSWIYHGDNYDRN